MWRINPLEHKVAFPQQTAKLLKSLTSPKSLSEITALDHGTQIADDLMKKGLVRRILVQQEDNGPEYIYIESVGVNATFKQGRRNSVRAK